MRLSSSPFEHSVDKDDVGGLILSSRSFTRMSRSLIIVGIKIEKPNEGRAGVASESRSFSVGEDDVGGSTSIRVVVASTGYQDC